MKLNSIESIKSFYDSKLGNEKHDIAHLEQMISYRFLSEIEKITEERNIIRKDLANLVGVSASYITQLYRGNKVVNLQFIAKVESALDFRFEIKSVAKEILEIEECAYDNWSESQVNNLIKKFPPTPNRIWIMKNFREFTPLSESPSLNQKVI